MSRTALVPCSTFGLRGRTSAGLAINDLVQQRIEGGDNDLVEIASMMAESLADLVLLAPDEDCANLMPHVVSALGQMVLEKSGAFQDSVRDKVALCLF